MNPFFAKLRSNPMFNFMQQYNQVRQNPQMLSQLLQQRGLIDERQAADIQRMGNNYEEIGRYLMKSGRMPNDIEKLEPTVNQVQNMMK